MKEVDAEALPVASARMMAILTLLMSLGFVAVVYLAFLQDVFQGRALVVVLLFMVTMSLLSSLVALRRIMKKVLFQHCGQPFFSRSMELSLAPKQCRSCRK